MDQEQFIRLSRLLDEANQRLDAEDQIAREQTERERTEKPRRLCARCQRNARTRAISSTGVSKPAEPS